VEPDDRMILERADDPVNTVADTVMLRWEDVPPRPDPLEVWADAIERVGLEVVRREPSFPEGRPNSGEPDPNRSRGSSREQEPFLSGRKRRSQGDDPGVSAGSLGERETCSPIRRPGKRVPVEVWRELASGRPRRPDIGPRERGRHPSERNAGRGPTWAQRSPGTKSVPL
jgi:hypothetical protein